MPTTPKSDEPSELGVLTPADVAEIRAYARLVEADPELAPVAVLFPEWRDDVDPEAA